MSSKSMLVGLQASMRTQPQSTSRLYPVLAKVARDFAYVQGRRRGSPRALPTDGWVRHSHQEPGKVDLRVFCTAITLSSSMLSLCPLCTQTMCGRCKAGAENALRATRDPLTPSSKRRVNTMATDKQVCVRRMAVQLSRQSHAACQLAERDITLAGIQNGLTEGMDYIA